MTAIRLHAVTKRFITRDGPVQALSAIDLAIAPGELVVLLGPSGCGKSTLLRLIGGLVAPSAGTVEIGDRPLWHNGARNDAALRDLGIVFQDANLFPWYSVEQNIALPLAVRGVRRADRLAQARAAAELVGLGGFTRSWPRQLSGGMRQRAALARALVTAPRILLLDEPFAALDTMTREAMNLELLRLWQHVGCTIVLVTHAIHEAVFLADRVALLTPRPGRIAAITDIPLPRPRRPGLADTEMFQHLAATLRRQLEQAA